MMTVLEIRAEIHKAKLELSNAIMTDNYNEVPRLVTALSVLKDTLLECYGETYSKNIIPSAVAGSDVNIVKYSPTDFSGPSIRIVK